MTRCNELDEVKWCSCYNFRYCTKPTELIVQCLPPKDNDVSNFLRDLVLTRKYFLQEHRFDPSEIYSDEFEDELKAIPDPKKEPIECLDQFLAVLNEFGAWCADRAALNLIAQIEKSKIKTPYERHYLLLCLVSTTLVQVRAYCEHVFQQISSTKECIELYSSPKAIRLLEILRQFKPEKTGSENTPKRTTDANENQNQQTTSPQKPPLTNGLSTSVDNSDESTQTNPILPKNKLFVSTHGAKKPKTMFQRTPRLYNSNYQNDPNALCGLIFCNSKFIAKILFCFLCEVSKCDESLEFLSVQFTGDRSADPITESKQFENEHRKQEEVLKRFRMHSCNLLIGTSVLEEGIELPKCNLVIRWNVPTTYRSYVQCKGRARAQKAFYIIMVAANSNDDQKACKESLSIENHRLICGGADTTSECCKVAESRKNEDNASDVQLSENLSSMECETENIVKLLAQYIKIEQILLTKCHNQEPKQQELVDADSYTHLMKPYQPIQSNDQNAPFVSLATAVVLVNKYCAKLPSDTFTKLTPLWRCAKTYRDSKEYFQYTVRLPINSPVKQDIYVSVYCFVIVIVKANSLWIFFSHPTKGTADAK